MKKTLFILVLSLSYLLSFGELASCNPMQSTEISSERMEMENKPTLNIFKFYENVHVIGENLNLISDYMEVNADRNASGKESPQALTPPPQMGAISQITATGHVKIEQEGRTAICGRAEIFPREGKIVLTENPILVDNNGRVEGFKITLFKDDRKALIDPYPEGGRTKVILPALPNLSFRSNNARISDTKPGDPQTSDLKDIKSSADHIQSLSPGASISNASQSLSKPSSLPANSYLKKP